MSLIRSAGRGPGAGAHELLRGPAERGQQDPSSPALRTYCVPGITPIVPFHPFNRPERPTIPTAHTHFPDKETEAQSSEVICVHSWGWEPRARSVFIPGHSPAVFRFGNMPLS